MQCNVLIPTAVVASRPIIGVEIADTIQQNTELTNHAGIVVGNASYEYKLVNVTYSIDEFLNNYNQFFYSGTSVYKSASFTADNRRLRDDVASAADNYFDRTIPYATNMIHNIV